MINLIISHVRLSISAVPYKAPIKITLGLLSMNVEMTNQSQPTMPKQKRHESVLLCRKVKTPKYQ